MREKYVPADQRQRGANLPGCPAKVEKVARRGQEGGLSTERHRRMFEARELLTVRRGRGRFVPATMTNTVGPAERDGVGPAASGVAYFSVRVRRVRAARPRAGRPRRVVKKCQARRRRVVLLQPELAPDGQGIASLDKAADPMVRDLDNGKSTKVDTAPVRRRLPPDAAAGRRTARVAGPSPGSSSRTTWTAVFLYSLDDGKTHQVTKRDERRPGRGRS